jgi:mono/diheme cytochrome c family protein
MPNFRDGAVIMLLLSVAATTIPLSAAEAPSHATGGPVPVAGDSTHAASQPAPTTGDPGHASGQPASAAGEPEQAAATSNEHSVAAGKVLFNSVGCWSCHGFNGQGATSRGIASGPRINARVLPEAAFLRQLRSPVSVMPPYTETVLTDEQAAQIYAYLRSLPEPVPAKDIALLKMPE